MELAKNQTSSPEPKEADDVFRPFLPAEVKVAPSLEESFSKAKAAGGFVLSTDFWTSILKEPWLKAELEKRVEERVAEHLKKEKEAFEKTLEPLKVQVIEESRKLGQTEGFEKGLAEGRTKAEADFQPIRIECETKLADLTEQVKKVGEFLLSEKKKLLADHEVAWSKALKELLVRFQVENALNLSSKIEAWMEERMDGFSKVDKVQVYLSPKEFTDLNRTAGELAKFPWNFHEDKTLKPGEMRAECGDGGFFFSRPDWLAELDTWLSQNFKKPELQLEAKAAEGESK